MFDRLKARFQDPLRVELREAHEAFREEKERDIEEARQRFDELRDRVDEELVTLEDRLEELDGYEDVKGRTVVEDVADNIVKERRRMVDRFSVSEDPEQLHEDLEEFIDRFKTMKRKETEVLKLMGEKRKPVFDVLGRVEAARDDLTSLLEGRYRAVETAEDLDDLVGELEGLEERREELQEELEAMDLEFTREKMDEVEGKLDSLHESGEWEEYRKLKQELDDLRGDLEDARSGIVKAANRMERGLKKLLYESPPLDGRDVLEDIRDGNVDALLEREPRMVEDAVRSAIEALPDDLLGERQERKFRDAAADLEGLGEKVERMDGLREEVEELEGAVDDHPAPERENRLSSELDGLQEELEESRRKRRGLREEIEEAGAEMERVKARIEEVLEEAFPRGVTVSGAH